jgi:predicted TIM-barrel fold metal-dependent hydrolase
MRSTSPVGFACRLAGAALAMVCVLWLVVPGQRRLSAAGPGANGSVTPGGLTVEQVMKMPKIDAHAHLAPLGPGQRDALVGYLEAHNFKWLDICTGGLRGDRLLQQIATAEAMHAAVPERFGWATTFNLSNWADGDWAKAATGAIAQGVAHGAVAVKVWKDVGMELRDADGRYVMVDDPRMAPVLDAIAKAGRPLVAHLGEPRNCWLPLDAMTTASDRNYYSNNPQYHGFLHPEVPGYEKQIAARDAVLARHPRLKVVGCHLGSLEYDVDEVARRLDRYPNFAVDLAARMVHLQIQPRDKVRAFVLKYQDRLIYGTDLSFGGGKADPPPDNTRALARLDEMYKSDAAWLATDEEIGVSRAREGFKSRGLALPASVLRKIYRDNARKWYPGL